MHASWTPWCKPCLDSVGGVLTLTLSLLTNIGKPCLSQDGGWKDVGPLAVNYGYDGWGEFKSA